MTAKNTVMTLRVLIFCAFSISLISCSSKNTKEKTVEEEPSLQFEKAAKEQLLDKWYPLVIDSADGGYYSEVTNDFQLGEKHDKMIVTQARHIWTNAKAAELFPEEEPYLEYAEHGFKFLKEVMWDKEHGGFFNLVSKKGDPILKKGEEKTSYGNAFAIYGLAAYYKASGDEEALELARNTFYWLEENSHDPEFKGYFNTLYVDGNPIHRSDEWPSTSDVGYKDQNSSIHLLEAFTELYQVWPNDLLAERLEELLLLIRDTITTEKGTMKLFFEPDWTPVTFKNESKEEIKRHYYLEHVSFGHDVETAFLMLEASHALGLENDTVTLKKGKMMVDHSLRTGWDEELGGFYDGGYYFAGEDSISIVNADKNWWAQAEGLNSLLIMDSYFPEDELQYRNYFDKLWIYIQTYLVDEEHGGWYEWGLDTRPDSETALKGHIWKATYHNFRALTNVMLALEEKKEVSKK
jgi:mannobiose 2-epimerase